MVAFHQGGSWEGTCAAWERCGSNLRVIQEEASWGHAAGVVASDHRLPSNLVAFDPWGEEVVAKFGWAGRDATHVRHCGKIRREETLEAAGGASGAVVPDSLLVKSLIPALVLAASAAEAGTGAYLKEEHRVPFS